MINEIMEIGIVNATYGCLNGVKFHHHIITCPRSICEEANPQAPQNTYST